MPPADITHMSPRTVHPAGRGPIGGFTLVELAVTAAIVGLLATAALPSFVKHVRKSHRAEAKSALLDLAERQERYYARTSAYAATPTALGYEGNAFPIDVATGSSVYYRLSAITTANATFLASATPVGSQAGDTCGTYTVNHLGTRGNADNTTATASCW